MSKHGTPLTTQFVKLLNAVTTAVATAVEGFSIADLLNVVTQKGETLTRFLRLVFTGLLNDQEIMLVETQAAVQRLLEPISVTTVNAVKEFIAKNCFQVGNSTGVTVASVRDNFKQHFLNKVERDVASATLKSFRLKKASLDPPIITELGSGHETALAHLWELLTKQPNGEVGPLRTSWWINIFYIRDTEGTLWAVGVDWHDGGWNVNAFSVEHPFRWHPVCQMFGR